MCAIPYPSVTRSALTVGLRVTAYGRYQKTIEAYIIYHIMQVVTIINRKKFSRAIIDTFGHCVKNDKRIAYSYFSCFTLQWGKYEIGPRTHANRKVISTYHFARCVECRQSSRKLENLLN